MPKLMPYIILEMIRLLLVLIGKPAAMQKELPVMKMMHK
jgi:hypothetical protein